MQNQFYEIHANYTDDLRTSGHHCVTVRLRLLTTRLWLLIPTKLIAGFTMTMQNKYCCLVTESQILDLCNMYMMYNHRH